MCIFMVLFFSFIYCNLGLNKDFFLKQNFNYTTNTIKNQQKELYRIKKLPTTKETANRVKRQHTERENVQLYIGHRTNI